MGFTTELVQLQVCEVMLTYSASVTSGDHLVYSALFTTKLVDGSTSSQVCHWPAQCNVDAGTPNGSERYDGPVAWVAVVPSDDTRATGLVKPRMHNDQ
ncbi:hypothetical protein T265_05802 [Opisthorchis viverrini]|uniref:Uncharacterized protein n=1 Tax=Opisthorchis viverrini TaxID=6198 RepID=A0A074ZIH6_OPIVI|nr:hypothetical protein T265_05802 [Opisthorchis viverrini]KER27113.1 hypothetical protein T265_05802 [Opisthorchis viverrini]